MCFISKIIHSYQKKHRFLNRVTTRGEKLNGTGQSPDLMVRFHSLFRPPRYYAARTLLFKASHAATFRERVGKTKADQTKTCFLY